jgi:5-formyltetrahydrofolate cyclo-ligase
MDNELDTRGVLAWALGEGKTVLVPVCMPKRAMAWSVLRHFDQLAPSNFGVLEPRADARELVPPPADAPVLVPGIAFDRRGYRIGYGAGYFDRFLAHHAGLKIGLAYECQIIDAVPHEPHDVKMDMIVTERGIDTIDWTG